MARNRLETREGRIRENKLEYFSNCSLFRWFSSRLGLLSFFLGTYISIERFYSTYRGGIRAVPWDVCNDLFDFSMNASDFLGYLEDRQYSGESLSCPCSGMSYIGDFVSRDLRDFIAYRVGISMAFASFVAYLQRPYNCSWFSASSPGKSIITNCEIEFRSLIRSRAKSSSNRIFPLFPAQRNE